MSFLQTAVLLDCTSRYAPMHTCAGPGHTQPPAVHQAIIPSANQLLLSPARQLPPSPSSCYPHQLASCYPRQLVSRYLHQLVSMSARQRPADAAISCRGAFHPGERSGHRWELGPLMDTPIWHPHPQGVHFPQYSGNAGKQEKENMKPF